VTAVLLLTAAEAAAQGFISGMVGSASGGFVTTSARTFGGQVGFLGNTFGVEGDFSYSKNIGPAPTAPPGIALGTLNMKTMMGTLLVGPSFGDHGRWHAYAAIGGGIVGAVERKSDVFTFATHDGQNEIALNVGGGFVGYLVPHLGVRVDVRYVRDLISHTDFYPQYKPAFIRFGGGLALRF
jgi:opacity protein-like surface antigen